MVSTETLVGILLTLKDEASAGLEKAGGALEGLGDKVTSAGAKFLVITEGFNKLSGMIDSFFSPALNFEAALTRSKIAMKLNDEEAAQLEGSLKSLSETAVGGIYSYEQTAIALQSISAECLGVEGSLQVMNNAMNLSASAGMELQQTAVGLTDVMSAWNMDAEDSGRLSDILLNTWRETSTAIPELMAGLKQSGVLMKSLGMSVEEAAATIGVFKDVGIDGINGLFNAFTQLSQGNSKASKTIAELGVSATDMAGNLKSPIALIQELSGAGLTATDILEMFGIRGAPAMITALENISKISEVTTENLNATGQATQAGEEFAKSSAAQHMKFEASVSNLKETLAEGLLPALNGLFNIINPILSTLTKYPEIIYAVVGGLIAWKIATIASTIATMGGTAAVWASTVAMLANPIVWIVLAIMGLILALCWLAKNWDKVTEAVGNFAKGAGEAWNGFCDWVGSGVEGIKKGLDDAGKWLGGVGDSIKNAFGGIGDFFGGLIDDFKEWGAHAVQSFREGMDSVKSWLEDGCKNIGNSIKNFLGFSIPPLFGPLHAVPEWGAHLIQEYVIGMRTEIPELNRTLANISRPPSGAGAAPSYAYATNDNRQVGQTNNFYINKGDPDLIASKVIEQLSAALG